MNVTLIGMGSGQPENLTLQGLAALRQADLILGARRLLAVLPAGCTENRAAAYRPDEVAELLQTSGAENAVLVYSGDTGFYSGASAMMEKLEALGVRARVLPGLSSIQLLAAALGRPWQGWNLVSAHGRTCDPVAECMQGRPTFFLTGGRRFRRRLGGSLLAEHDADLAPGHDQLGFRHSGLVAFPNGGGVGNDGWSFFLFRLLCGLVFPCTGDLFPQGGEQVAGHAVKTYFRQVGAVFLIFIGRIKLGQAGQEVFKRIQVGGALEEVANGFPLDAFHQGNEQVVGFRLVFHQGILLALGAEANAFPQRVHVVQVLLPHFVNSPQDDLAFHVVQVFRTFAGSLVFISGLDLVNEEGDGVIHLAFFQLGGVRCQSQWEGCLLYTSPSPRD